MGDASDSSWEVSASEEEGSQDEDEGQEAIEEDPPRRKNGKRSTVTSWLPYNELCEIQGAVRDAIAGELRWSFCSARAHGRWPQVAPKPLQRASESVHVPHDHTDDTPEHPQSGTGLAPHSCYRHPEPAHIQWIEDGSTAGGFKWPQVLQEPPAVPQAMTATRDNTNPPHGEMLNSLADEKLVAGTGIPVRVYAPPSLELIKAMSEHLSATAFLPSLMADLDNLMPQRHLAQSAQERRKHTSMVNDRIEAIHKAVEERLQPARDELRRLHSTCLSVAGSAAAQADLSTADRSTHEQPMHPVELQIRAALQANGEDCDEDGLPAADAPGGEVGGAADCAHSRVAEAAVNAGATILNHALSQVKYPYRSAWTRYGRLLHKDPMAEYDQLLMNPAAVSDHLLAPGHAPLARNGRSPLGALEVPVPHMDATNTGPAHQAPLPPGPESHAQRAQRTMAAAMPATLRAVEVDWGEIDTPTPLHGGSSTECHVLSHAIAVQTSQQQQCSTPGSRSCSLRSLAVQLAQDWMRNSSVQQQANKCRHSGPEATGSSPSAPSNKEQRAHALAKVNRCRAPLIPQPVAQLLPAETVCRLLDNESQFRVVIEFEWLVATTTATDCGAGHTGEESAGSAATTEDEEDGGQSGACSSRSNGERQHSKVKKHTKAKAKQKNSGKKMAPQKSTPVQQNCWFAAEVPLSQIFVRMFLTWPPDSGPPTVLGRGGSYLMRFYLRRSAGSVQPKTLLPRQLESAFMPVPDASTQGDGRTLPEASAQAACEDLCNWPEQESAAFLYPSAYDAGLVSTFLGRAELESLCVARHWSSRSAFGLARYSDSAAQSSYRLPASSTSHSAAQQPPRVWALLSGEVRLCSNYTSAFHMFEHAANHTEEVPLSAQPVVVAAVNKEGLRANQPRTDEAAVEVMLMKQALAGTSAVADNTNADPATANEECEHRPWLVAAGYLGRRVAAMQPHNQESVSAAPAAMVKCNRDEVDKLVGQNAIALNKTLQRRVAEVKKASSAADVDSDNSQGSGVGGPSQSQETRSADENKSSCIRGKKRPAPTEVMGLNLNDMVAEKFAQRKNMMRNAVAVVRALSEVKEVEAETGLDLGDVPADVTMMFRSAQASGLPVSILQRAADRWKQVIAAQNSKNARSE